MVCTFSRRPKSAFWGSRLFNPISSLNTLKEVGFEFVPRITPLQIEHLVGALDAVVCGLGKRGKRCLLYEILRKIEILFNVLQKFYYRKALKDSDYFHYQISELFSIKHIGMLLHVIFQLCL